MGDDKEMNKFKRIMYFSEVVDKFLIDNELYCTVGNIRRFFAFRYQRMPSERVIREMYSILDKKRNQNMEVLL